LKKLLQDTIIFVFSKNSNAKILFVIRLAPQRRLAGLNFCSYWF